MIKSGVGFSTDLNDSKKAGEEACKKAIEQLGEEPNFVLVFASSLFKQDEIVAGVKQAAPNALMVGCSDAGEIVTSGPMTKGVVVMAVASDEIEFIVGMGDGVGADSTLAGKKAAEDLLKKLGGKKPVLVISILEGLTGNGAAIVRGMQQVLGEHFPIIGGSAGDDFAFKKTFEYFDGKAVNDMAIAVGLVGNFSWGMGVRHGWEPIGLPMKVTKSEGAVLKELDGKPALKIYEDVFGTKAEDLVKNPLAWLAYTYPLGMSIEGSSELLIRDVVIANEKGEITCAAEIPEGSEIRLMLGDPEKAIKAAKEVAESALAQLNGTKPKAIFIFNCIARFKLLTEGRIGEEIAAVQEVLGKDVPLIGFYTYGEQAPIGGNIDPAVCHSAFHNETMALLVLGE